MKNSAKVTVDKTIPIIDVENYTKTFGKFTSNKDVTFKVGHGVIHGFIGPNGSGKTTTMKTLIGAYTLESGKMLVNGYKPGTKEANSIIGYIPERSSFPSHLNCIDYLVSMGILSGLSKKESKSKATDILTNLGMQDFAKRKPGKFSSGMQKKILLAQSLMSDPSLLILDEPSANLDPTARKDLQEELIRLRDQGKSIFISTHILSELERIVDEVTFLYYGQVLYTGKVDSINTKNKGIFIKTENNKLCIEHLCKIGYTVLGDVKGEFFVKTTSQSENMIINKIISNDLNVNIISFRANDLQTVYDELITDAMKNNKGNQVINNKKVKPMKDEKEVSTNV
jgi:ABC-2 type transport system ATP-binding protein